jgi:shikimate dehydrogenase
MAGMDEDESPVPADLIRPEMLVFDLIYRPFETRLLREAAARGARVLSGLPMLIYQGAASFKIWTGQDAPVDVMFDAARRVLVEDA